MMDYFKHAQAYVDVATELEALGCYGSAKRAHEKASFWIELGRNRIHAIETANALKIQHGHFMDRCTRRRRWLRRLRWKRFASKLMPVSDNANGVVEHSGLANIEHYVEPKQRVRE